MLDLESFAAINATPKAEYLHDGRVIVRDVPIFSELRKTDPSVASGSRVERGPEWLARALEIDQARQRDGHFAPMNLRHTFDQIPPKKVGTRALRSIRKLRVNPQDEDERDTIFGDEIFDSRAAFEEARDHEHRSPEISTQDWPDEIGPLALLREASPFNKYPNVKAAPPELVAAAEAFEAKGRSVEQAWSRRELFEAKNPYAVANAMLAKGEITKSKFDRVVKAIDEKSEDDPEKEGAMPPVETKDEKKTPSLEERMEACFAKFEEKMVKAFEARISGAGKGDHKEPDGDEKHGDEKHDDKPHETPAEKKAEEKSSTSTPELSLPPAVSQAKAGEQFAAMVKTQGQRIVMLEAALAKTQRDRDSEHFAAEAETTLAAAGVPVTESTRRFLRADALEGGKPAVARLVEREIALHKERAALQPAFDAYGAFGAHASAQGDGRPPELAKALETFGSSPQKKAQVQELFASWYAQDGLFKNLLSFEAVCRGDPTLNPAGLSDRGGLKNGGR